MPYKIVLLVLLASLSVGSSQGLAEEQPRDQARAADSIAIARWIAELDDGQFSVRQAASRKLREAGRAAVEPLTAAADGKRSEVIRRAIEVLDSFCDSEDAETATAAGEALKKLARSSHRLVAHRAAVVLRGQRLRRQWAALTEVQRLGGIVGSATIEDGELVLGSLVLGRKWEAGDQGLKYLPRLGRIEHLKLYGQQFTDEGLEHLTSVSGVQKLMLYVTEISEDGRRRLQEALPGTAIDLRRGALLGVLGTPGAACRVNTVKPDSAAERAGIESDDLIVSVDGQQVPDLSTLIAIIAKQKPGDRIHINLLRGDEPLEKDVVLGELGEDTE